MKFLREAYPEEDKLPEDGLYRYLLQPSEEHDDQRRRAMDRIWSKATYRLREVVEDSGNSVMNILPKRWTRESFRIRRADVNSCGYRVASYLPQLDRYYSAEQGSFGPSFSRQPKLRSNSENTNF